MNNTRLLLPEQCAARFKFILGITDHAIAALMGKKWKWDFVSEHTT